MSASAELYFTCAAVRHRRRRPRLSERLTRAEQWTFDVSSLGWGGGWWCAAVVVVHDVLLADLPRPITTVRRQTRINTRIRSQWAVEHYTGSFTLQSASHFHVYYFCFWHLFLCKALITSSVILQKYQLIRGALPSIGNNCHPSKETLQ